MNPMLVTEMAALLVLVNVADLGPPALPTDTAPQLIEVGETEIEPLPEDEPPVPSPETAICCGLPLALSVKLRVAVRVPDAVGLKMMFAVQLAEAARLAPHVLLKTAKSPAFVPVNAMLLMVMAAVPLLVSVATFWPPALPTATLPQVIELGDAVAAPYADAGM